MCYFVTRQCATSHLAYRSDLTPCLFYLVGSLKYVLKVRHFADDDEVKQEGHKLLRDQLRTLFFFFGWN